MRKLLAGAALLAAAFGWGCGTEDGTDEGAGGSGGVGGDTCVPAAGEALEVPEASWTWVPIEGSVCRD